MLARLWWKDARQFWPIWVLLAVVGLAAQSLILHYAGEKARNGELVFLALGWTCLYAFAVATAAFAGERENRTLHLLDALPVDRWRLWTGKVSFAFVSTLLLGLVLFLAAALTTDKWVAMEPWNAVFAGTAILIVVLGSSLFWSAVMTNALLAGVLGVFTALLMIPALDVGLRLKLVPEIESLNQLFYGLLTLVASGLLFIRSGPPRRPLIRRGVQPLTIRPATAPVPVAARTSRRLRFWPAAARSVAWQTFRDLRSIWLWLALLCLAVPPCLYIGQRAPFEAWMLCILMANLVAGVSVFGIENRARTHAFLANQGVQPGLVWLVRTSIWLIAMVVIWVLTGLLSILFTQPRLAPTPNIVDVILLGSGVVLITLVVPILCGMVIRRGITAGTVSVLVLLLVLPPLFGLTAAQMMPSVFLVLVPLVFLAVSFAWSRDWMMNRPGARQWVKLAALLVAGFGALFVAYITVRIQGVPTLEPARDAELFRITTPTTPNAPDNAADLYRQAARSISPLRPDVYSIVQNGWDPKADQVIAWYQHNAKALELIRKATTMPACQFTRLDQLTLVSPSYDAGDRALISPIAPLLALSVLDHQARGDLDGAWNDLAVMFRVARQWSGAEPVEQVFAGLECERTALSRAMVWATDERQTPERLRIALDAYHDLSRMPNAAEPIRAEAQIVRNTERLPRSELVEKISIRGVH